MRVFVRYLLMLSLILLVPIVPFVVFGQHLESWVEAWAASPPSPQVTTAAIIGLLASDILLPVPSSVVATLGGAQLGLVGGTAASTIGMSIGAIGGFALARRWGRPLALKFSRHKDLEQIEQLVAQYGPVVIVLTRGVPVLAEASILLVGINRLSLKQFLLPMFAANLGIALAYSAFGKLAAEQQWLPTAVALSIGLPILLTAMVRLKLRHKV